MKLLSLNVQADNHLDRVRELVAREKADTVALMEVLEEDLDKLLPDYHYRNFAPNFHLPDGRMVGVVLAAKTEIRGAEHYYADGKDEGWVPVEGMGTHRPVMVRGTIEGINMGAVHFTWTPDMSETERQNSDLVRLLDKIKGEEIVMAGDFNIPRGNKPYRRLARIYRDNIPGEVATTISAPKL